jgi:hypothetical protein
VRTLALTLLFAATSALAENPDEAALALADQTQIETKQARDWRVLTEAALSESKPRAGGSPTHAQRLSLDAAYDTRFAPQWRAVFADRLDLAWRGRVSSDDFINTLKETYLSWQPQPDNILDLGRVNLRNGVAGGYNPTDFFRAGAVRSIVSVNPASLRENRLGSVMLRGQTLWGDGSLTALYSPKLADRPSDSPFSADLGATNNQNRWAIALSQRLAPDVNPQWLLYGEEHRSPRMGLNITTLVNDATVAFLEWSGARSPSQRAQALGLADDTRFRSRTAAGLTYTAPSKLSLTLEYDYNGAGLDENNWDALRRGSPAAYLQYRGFVQTQQELPTKHNVFFYAQWQDAIVVHLDFSAMQRVTVADRSRLSWLEARYRWEHADLALQWQLNSGGAGSEFGASSQRQVWQALVTYFF